MCTGKIRKIKRDDIIITVWKDRICGGVEDYEKRV